MKLIKEFSKFIIVSIIGIVVNVSVLVFITEVFGIFYIVSYFLASIVSGVLNFMLNKHWTFKETSSEISKMAKQYARFFSINLTMQLMGAFMLYFFTEYFGIHYAFSQVIVLGFIWTILFIFYKAWVFKT